MADEGGATKFQPRTRQLLRDDIVKEVEIVLVGIGGYGATYLGPLLDANVRGDVRLAGAVDPAPERCGRLDELKGRGVALYDDIAGFYADRTADLAVICAPIHLHAPCTCLALSRGSSVLCEKPLAATIQEARRMADAEAASPGFVAIGYQWSFSDAIQALKRDVMAGEFGRPIRLRTLVSWPRRRSYYKRNSWAAAVKSPDGAWVLDSPANNATAHFLHNMFYVLGPTREASDRPVDVQAELYRANDIENYDTAAIRCHTEAGAEVLFYTLHPTAERIGPAFHYEFEQATVSYGWDGGSLIVAELRDGTRRDYGSPEAARLNKLWQSVGAVKGGERVACGIEAATAQTLCINGAQESVEEVASFPGDLLHVDEQDDGDRLTWVDGLFESFERCCERGILPAEDPAVSWARPGRVVDLTGYTSFPSGSGARDGR